MDQGTTPISDTIQKKYLLPEEIYCPWCEGILVLDEEEREVGEGTCVHCETLVTYKSVISDFASQSVVVTDIRMSFSSMVVFMVKAVIASIPAAIILWVLGFIFWSIFAALLMF